MQGFCKYLRGEIGVDEVSEIAISAQNHRLSFLAEESRLAGGKCIAL
jgi:hypothetical protein